MTWNVRNLWWTDMFSTSRMIYSSVERPSHPPDGRYQKCVRQNHDFSHHVHDRVPTLSQRAAVQWICLFPSLGQTVCAEMLHLLHRQLLAGSDTDAAPYGSVPVLWPVLITVWSLSFWWLSDEKCSVSSTNANWRHVTAAACWLVSVRCDKGLEVRLPNFQRWSQFWMSGTIKDQSVDVQQVNIETTTDTYMCIKCRSDMLTSDKQPIHSHDFQSMWVKSGAEGILLFDLQTRSWTIVVQGFTCAYLL